MEVVVFVSVAAAVILWALAEVFVSRALWTAALLLMMVHAVAAFVEFYAGSHAVAQTATMRQTAALTGIEFAGGIYINYLFLAVWSGDVAWWWLAPRSYAVRPRWVSWTIRGFIVFIIVNGAVVFADGGARVIGVAAVASVVLGAWPRTDRSAAARLIGAWPRHDRSDSKTGIGAWPQADTSDMGRRSGADTNDRQAGNAATVQISQRS